MLEFYEFNTLNITIVLFSTFIIYYIIFNFFTVVNNEKNNETKKNEFSLEYLIISVIIAIIISLIVAYVLSSGEESILTDNYWEPIKNSIKE